MIAQAAGTTPLNRQLKPRFQAANASIAIKSDVEDGDGDLGGADVRCESTHPSCYRAPSACLIVSLRAGNAEISLTRSDCGLHSAPGQPWNGAQVAHRRGAMALDG